MPWLGTVTVVGLIVLAGLIWLFLRARTQDHLTELTEKRRATAKIVGRADYMEGLEKIGVVLALTDDIFFYENADLQASFELSRIDEIEYDDELATGHSLDHGCRALRLRSHGTVFDFVMSIADANRWEQVLPARRAGQSSARAV